MLDLEHSNVTRSPEKKLDEGNVTGLTSEEENITVELKDETAVDHYKHNQVLQQMGEEIW